MSFRTHRSTSLALVLAALVLCGATVISLTNGLARLQWPRVSVPGQQERVAARDQGPPASRNLSLQPEALNLSRKVGRRFSDSRRDVSTLVGTLTLNSETQAIEIKRRQRGRGETVEISVNGRRASLTWSEDEGARGNGGGPNNNERHLIERIALDSPDQFILAQLRGASYRTVQRDVRDDDSGGSESYDGPIWTVVRVDDPEENEARRPLSSWRLYYINSRTGLIDKIAYEIGTERIEVRFSAWAIYEGEKVPSQISWSRDGQLVMALTVTGFVSEVRGGAR